MVATRSWILSWTLAALIVAMVPVMATHDRMLHSLRRRAISTTASDLNGQSFDYIIVGGGQAGLVVASRLTEDANITVAVIEAGKSGMDEPDADKINVPAANLYNSPANTELDWQFKTAAQDNLNGRTTNWPRGKTLGGSSAINGLYYVRPSDAEITAWSNLMGGSNSQWSWDNMLNAMKKAESFTPAHQDVADIERIEWSTGSHGQNGPVHSSWPSVPYEVIGAFVNSSVANAAPYNADPYAGTTAGTFVACSNINPSNWTRSFSRTAYIDPNVARPNLHILTGTLVTKVLFDTSQPSNVKATGVSFQQSKNGQTYTVNANREVILSAGTVNTPQVLQLSGVADSALLKSHNIDTVVDLPGVGYNLQDHLSGGVQWTPKSADIVPPVKVTGNATVDSYINSAVAYVNGTALLGDQWQAYLDSVAKNQSAAVSNYKAPADVQKGYNQTYTTTLDLIKNGITTVELIYSLTFGNIQVQAAMQHPFSRGSVLITSDNAFDYPAIDPRYLEQSADMTMLLAGFKLARKVGSSAPHNNYIGTEQHPGSAVTSDDDWMNFIRGAVMTEFHPSGTASLLPRELGGVVDQNLLVYGTSNLRVIDASIIPIAMSAHYMSLVYGLSEIGAGIVKKAQAAAAKPAPTSSAAAGAAGGAKTASSKGGNSASVVSSNAQGAPANAGARNSNAGTVRAHAAAWTQLLSMVLVTFLVM